MLTILWAIHYWIMSGKFEVHLPEVLNGRES